MSAQPPLAGDGSRWLYLARHGEPEADGSGLSARGLRQAARLGRRLAQLPLSRIVHDPLPRAAETARVVAEQFVPPPHLTEVDAAGDYVPYVPTPGEVPDAWTDTVLSSFADVSEQEALEGASLGSRATDLLTGPGAGGRERIDVVITNTFTIGWLVRHALDAPHWRWWGPHQWPRGTDGDQVPGGGSPDGRGVERREPPAHRPPMDRVAS